MAKRTTEFGAIETVYRGFEFRSRLEAKWAVFFDLCGWQWSYEPQDLNGWIPDFALGETFTLVEVKPFFKDDEWADALQKIVASGYRGEVVCLGADPTVLGTDCNGGSKFGWLFEQEDGLHSHLTHLDFGFTEENGKLGLCPMDTGWHNVIWKTSTSKGSRVAFATGDAEKNLVANWAQATNLTKWFPSGENR